MIRTSFLKNLKIQSSCYNYLSRHGLKGSSIISSAEKNYFVIGNDNTFTELENSSAKKVFYFTASWCPPCKTIAPIFLKLSEEYKSLNFVKIDIDEFPDAAAKYQIRSVPTFVFLSASKQISQVLNSSYAISHHH
jgi:thioredoxin 1